MRTLTKIKTMRKNYRNFGVEKYKWGSKANLTRQRNKEVDKNRQKKQKGGKKRSKVEKRNKNEGPKGIVEHHRTSLRRRSKKPMIIMIAKNFPNSKDRDI
jgi:hypothetical protein